MSITEMQGLLSRLTRNVSARLAVRNIAGKFGDDDAAWSLRIN